VGPVVLIITHGYSGQVNLLIQISLPKNGCFADTFRYRAQTVIGYQAQAHTGSDIDNGLYTHEAGRKTYLHLADCAKIVLEAGFSAIIDAAFLKTEQRDLFKKACR